ncbi:MAG: hypothetical protein ACFFCS_26030 [Candidatus Hodarchaeota archaeon]
MKIKKVEIKLINNKGDEPLQNQFLNIVHPLAMSPMGDKCTALLIPAWIDSPANLVDRKLTFLEIKKP